MNGAGFLVLLCRGAFVAEDLVEYCEENLGWKSVRLEPRMTLLAESGSTITGVRRVSDRWVIGSLFDRTSAGSDNRVGSGQDVIAAGSVEFTKRYWGSYLTFGRNAAQYTVFRDPSAAMPCYYFGGATFLGVSNSVPMMVKAGIVRPSIDWSSLAEILGRAGLPTAKTALCDVHELLPGHQILTSDDMMEIRQVWSPWDYVSFRMETDAGAASAHLREIIDDCTQAWARQFDRVLLTLSGGLDSSIVLASCCGANTSLTGLTLSTADPDGDERAFARDVSGHLGVPLLEAEYSIDDMDMSRSAYARLPRPIGRATAIAHDAIVARTMDILSATALLTGVGGDNVFGYSQSAAAIVDHYRAKGWSRGLASTVANVCLLTGCSAFEAIASARRLNRRSPRYRWRRDLRLLSREIAGQLAQTPLDHPWLNGPTDAVPGKAAHIAGILRLHNHLNNVNRFSGKTVISPLMSQPVVETCLGIPSWLWCLDGRDRAIARMAFESALPARIIDRVSKGGPDGFANEFLASRRDQVRDVLMNGALSRHGLIDRDAISRILFSEKPDTGSEQVRLLELIDAEAWVMHWQAQVQGG